MSVFKKHKNKVSVKLNNPTNLTDTIRKLVRTIKITDKN